MRLAPGFALVAWLAVPWALAAQTPPQKPIAPAPAAAANPSPSSAAAAPVAADTAKAPESYSYNPEGRRDPFVSLLGSGAEQTTGSSKGKGEGAGSLMLSEISVRGVVQSRGTLVAMVEGPDKKTYIVHAGDKLADGTIRTITPQGLVVIQQVNDPLSLVKQREVRKLLRSLEDAKE